MLFYSPVYMISNTLIFRTHCDVNIIFNNGLGVEFLRCYDVTTNVS